MNKVFQGSVHTNEWRSHKPVMRKYYQLTLVIISVISVVSLLIYRHEYNRLRYVLEVLNFFGTPGQSATVNDCSPLNITRSTYDILSLREHLPAWQRIGYSYFVYSAFWENIDGNHVKAIGVGLNTAPKFKCHVWFDDVDDPVPGKFSSVLLREKSHLIDNLKPPKKDALSAYFMYCKPPTSLGSPVGVAFYEPLENVPFSPFIPVQSLEDRTVVENSTLVCVAPGIAPHVPKTAVVEFLSYHQLVGISDFVVYDQTVSNQFPVVFQNRVWQDRYNLRVLFLPWNFPFPSEESDKTVRLAVEKDCIMRAMGKVRNIVVLSWNEYIVPKLSRSLTVMLDNLDSERKVTARFDIPTLTFCTDLPDDIQADETLPLAARKSKCLKGSGLVDVFHVYRPLLVPGNRTGSTQTVSQKIAAIHRYQPCARDRKLVLGEENLMYDSTLLMVLAGDWKRSKLLRASMANKLFQ